jgi:hypothetical protein
MNFAVIEFLSLIPCLKRADGNIPAAGTP